MGEKNFEDSVFNFTEEQKKEIIAEFVELYKENYHDFDIDDVDIIDEPEFEQDGKYQNRVSVIKYKNLLIGVSETRSGSYHTDWHYSDTFVYAVRPEQVIKTVYKVDGPYVEIPAP